jgi:hypothetical protein
VARDIDLRPQRGDVEVLRQGFIEGGFQRQRRPLGRGVSRMLLRKGATCRSLARHPHLSDTEHEEHTHTDDRSLHDIPARFVCRSAHGSTNERNRAHDTRRSQ